jgi:branched-chain amino acid aminotransferase
MKVYLNGNILDEDKAKISIFDRGFLYGDGIFETARSYDGIVFRLKDHLDRLYSSMKSLKIRQALAKKETEKAVYKLLSVNNLVDASIRITVTRGISMHRGFNISQNEVANTIIVATPFSPRPVKFYNKGIKVDITRFRKNSQNLITRFKALNYLESVIVRNEAVPKGSFETLFLNENAYVCEGTVSNIFMVKGNRLMTPSLDCGILPGIARKIVLESTSYAGLGKEEGRFTEEDLKNSDEVFVTNSLIEIIPVVKIDDKQIGNGKPGTVTHKLHSLYKELVREETKR